MVLKRSHLILALVLIIVILSSCSGDYDSPRLFSPIKSPEVEPALVPTPTPPKVLSVCLGEEPSSLFIYGDLSTSADIIRQAIYDDPVDEVNFLQSSQILEQIPSLENELVSITEVEIYPGDRLVDAKGNITVLASGVLYRPSGCTNDECWQVYDGEDSILLDQVTILFLLESDLHWADGVPLTPADSIFSYQVAQQIYGSSGPSKSRFTYTYELSEDNEIIWKGLPGFKGVYAYPDFFFPPLPEHLWSNLSREEFLTSAQTTQRPLSWGPYQVIEWIRGDHITLKKNEQYHGNSNEIPAFDSLVFRFIDGGEEALAAFSSGECQIILNEPGIVDFQTDLIAEEYSGRLKLYSVGGFAWEQLSFGINSLDSETSLLKNKNLRLVISQCINRESISTSRLDAGEIVNDFFLPGDPRIETAENILSFQPTEAGLSLRELGWIDHDGDPATARLADGVDGIKDGTSLKLTLLVSGTTDVPMTVEQISSGLENCGIGIDIELLPPIELLAPGPDGLIFGRKFDLALFSWAPGHYQRCRLFTTDEIPGMYPEYIKGWGGVNATGYSNSEFDIACNLVNTNLPDSAETLQALEQIRMIYQADLPALPLFFRNGIIVAKPDLKGIENGIYSQFWNLERIR